MRKLLFFALVCLGFVLVTAASGRAQVSAGVSFDRDGLKSFYLAIGDYYNLPERAVATIKKKNVPDEELPVVFYIAQRAGVKPAAVIELRSIGKSWLDITLHFGLSPEIYYVPVAVDPGPPYGRAYGHFKNHPKEQWKDIELSDVDIVNLCNLRFVSKYYGVAPEDVIRLRSEGHAFVTINGEAKQLKANQQKSQKAQKSFAKHDDNNKGKGNGKGNNKGNAKGNGQTQAKND